MIRPSLIVSFREMPNDNLMPQGYKLEEIAREKFYVSQEGMLPGMFGFTDMYIRHLWAKYDHQTLLIVSYTEHDLDQTDVDRICAGAIEFLRGINEQR